MRGNYKIKICLGLIVFLSIANFFIWKEVLGLSWGLEVVFFDVGQGDAIFVESSQGHQVLIDGGPSGDRILEKLSGEMPFWDRSLDLVILTHPDYDHLRGLLDVLDRYKVENILWTGVLRETKTFEKWLEKLEQEKEQGAEVFIAQKGQIIKLGSGTEQARRGANLYILHPFEKLEGVTMEKGSNDSSIVAKLVFGESSFLFTGDITKRIEAMILEASCEDPVSASCGDRVFANILKVAHHGSKSANSKEFLQMVGPEIAVISCGKDNKYGHPAQEVLSNLTEFGITVLRTDELGDIKIKANYEGYAISNLQN